MEVTRTTLAVLFIGGLLEASSLVIRPFLPAAVWPTTLVIATWPPLLSVQVRLNGRRGLAVTVMTLVLSLVVLVPLLFAVSAVVSRSERVVALVSVLPDLRFPTPPNWVTDVPVLGKPLSSRWESLADGSTADNLQRARPYVGTVTRWLIGMAGSFGGPFFTLF